METPFLQSKSPSTSHLYKSTWISSSTSHHQISSRSMASAIHWSICHSKVQFFLFGHLPVMGNQSQANCYNKQSSNGNRGWNCIWTITTRPRDLRLTKIKRQDRRLKRLIEQITKNKKANRARHLALASCIDDCLRLVSLVTQTKFEIFFSIFGEGDGAHWYGCIFVHLCRKKLGNVFGKKKSQNRPKSAFYVLRRVRNGPRGVSLTCLVLSESKSQAC